VKFLIDNAVSPGVAETLRQAGHDAIHVADYGMAAAKDTAILARAAAEERIIVSTDTDFGTLSSARDESKPSVILFRRGPNRRSDEQARLLIANLPQIADDLKRGAIVIIEQYRMRVRSLPIRRN
jgi:predicted nuclease of predicted toxin-antitoxin system